MAPITEWLAVLAGFMVRLAFPAGLTLIVAWLLHQLDIHWQAEATDAAPRRFAGLHPACWVTQHCSAERQVTCPAYGQNAVPCWQFFRDARGNLRAECLTCQVLKQAPAVSAA